MHFQHVTGMEMLSISFSLRASSSPLLAPLASLLTYSIWEYKKDITEYAMLWFYVLFSCVQKSWNNLSIPTVCRITLCYRGRWSVSLILLCPSWETEGK